MRILITGIKGFTGRYLESKLIECGHEVIGLQSDLMDAFSLNREIKKVQPDSVVHLAGLSFVAHSNKKDFYNINIIGTYNLLNSLDSASLDLKNVLIASSSNVYGGEHKHHIREEDALNPANDYAVSKLSSEYVSKLFMDRLPIFITRPFNYTGVGQSIDFLIPKIIRHFLEKKPQITLGNTNIHREFNDVRNVVDIYSDLLMKPFSGKIFNICTEETHSITDVINMCEKITEHKLEVKIDAKLCRNNEAIKIAGNGQYLRNYTQSGGVFNLNDTLLWMLNKNNI